MLDKFSGLKNTVAPERLAEGELAVALNIDIDDAGQIKRRRGKTLLLDGSWHSLYAAHDGVYAVRNYELVFVSAANSVTVLQSGFDDTPVSYTMAGHKLYFSTPLVNGIASPDGVSAWGLSSNSWDAAMSGWAVTIPVAGDIGGRLMSGPPKARHISYFNGRIYLAVGSVLWATEMYDYNRVDRTKNYKQFEGRITALGAVTDGLYVGTDAGLFFLTGPLDEMRRVKVLDTSVTPYSVVHGVDPKSISDKLNSLTSILVLTGDGLYACLDSGQALSLTDGRYIFPPADTAAAVVRSQDGIEQVVLSTKSSGSPASSARFGDYVDAEIRRFNGGCYAAR